MKFNHITKSIFALFLLLNLYPNTADSKKLITVSNLEDVSLDAIGLDSKLGNDIWKNTSYDFFYNNLKNIKTNSDNKYYNQIAKDILVAGSIPPKGEFKKGEIIELRLNKLMKLGYFSEVKNIISQINDVYKTEAIRDIEAKAILSLDGPLKACKYLDRNDLTNLQAQKIRIVCNIYDNEEDKAKLGLSLMMEEKNPKDDFITIATSLLENKSLEDDIKINNIETVFLASKKHDNDFILEHSSEDNYIYLILSNFENRDKLQQLPILVKSYNKGLIKSGKIETLYKEIALKKKDKESYFDFANRVENNNLKVIAFYKDAKDSDDLKNRIRLANLALNTSKNEESYNVNAKIFSKFIENQNPNINLKNDIENIVELLIAAEKYNYAKLWFDFGLVNDKENIKAIHSNIIAITSNQEKYINSDNLNNAHILSSFGLYANEFNSSEEKIENIDVNKIFSLQHAVKDKDYGKALLLSLDMIASDSIFLNYQGIKALNNIDYKNQARDIAISKLK